MSFDNLTYFGRTAVADLEGVSVKQLAKWMFSTRFLVHEFKELYPYVWWVEPI